MSTTFIKAQASSVIATAADFLTTFVCRQFLSVWYLAASFIGTFIGGVTNFGLNRRWVFDGRDKKVHAQVIKYLITWGGNMVLTTLGVFILKHYFGFDLFPAKIISAVIVGVCYNYMLQKKFVFA